MAGTQSESALRNNKSGTISQQSTSQVQHQYSAHYTGGESSTNKRPQEMSALDRLKCIQNNFRQQWHGINCEISGRPGEYFWFFLKEAPLGVSSSAVALRLQIRIFTSLGGIKSPL